MPRVQPVSTMNCIIVDDEEPARARLRRMLDAHPDVTIVAEARDGVEAVQEIEEHRPALVFLDIELPGIERPGSSAVAARERPYAARDFRHRL